MAAASDINISCQICYQTYVTPRSLPCGHTVCHDCLEKHVESATTGCTFRCPFCGKPVFIDTRSKKSIKSLVESFPVNIALVHTIQQIETLKSKKPSSVKTGPVVSDSRNIVAPGGDIVNRNITLNYYTTPVPSSPGKVKSELEAALSELETSCQVVDQAIERQYKDWIHNLDLGVADTAAKIDGESSQANRKKKTAVVRTDQMKKREQLAMYFETASKQIQQSYKNSKTILINPLQCLDNRNDLVNKFVSESDSEKNRERIEEENKTLITYLADPRLGDSPPEITFTKTEQTINDSFINIGIVNLKFKQTDLELGSPTQDRQTHQRRCAININSPDKVTLQQSKKKISKSFQIKSVVVGENNQESFQQPMQTISESDQLEIIEVDNTSDTDTLPQSTETRAIPKSDQLKVEVVGTSFTDALPQATESQVIQESDQLKVEVVGTSFTDALPQSTESQAIRKSDQLEVEVVSSFTDALPQSPESQVIPESDQLKAEVVGTSFTDGLPQSTESRAIQESDQHEVEVVGTSFTDALPQSTESQVIPESDQHEVEVVDTSFTDALPQSTESQVIRKSYQHKVEVVDTSFTDGLPQSTESQVIPESDHLEVEVVDSPITDTSRESRGTKPNQMKLVKVIDSRHSSDTSIPGLYAITLLEVDRSPVVVVADRFNKSIKSYIYNDGSLHRICETDGRPGGIVKMGDCDVAVTLPDSKQIAFMSVDMIEIIVTKCVNTEYCYEHIALLPNGNLAVSVPSNVRASINILDPQCQAILSLNISPLCLTVSESFLLVVTGNNSVMRIMPSGELIFVTTPKSYKTEVRSGCSV